MNVWEEKKKWRDVKGPFYGELWMTCSKCEHENEYPLEEDITLICVFICDKCEEPLFIISPEVSDVEEEDK